MKITDEDLAVLRMQFDILGFARHELKLHPAIWNEIAVLETKEQGKQFLVKNGWLQQFLDYKKKLEQEKQKDGAE